MSSNDEKTALQKQANFLSLTNLQKQLPKSLFGQIVDQVRFRGSCQFFTNLYFYR